MGLKFCVPQLLQFSLLLLASIHASVLADDLDTIYGRRLQRIISSTDNVQLAERWRNELTSNGNWTDVDYTAGCPARRANWPAQDHWHRITTMSSAWYQNQTDVDLLGKISFALDYWFDRDYTEDDCINAGGNDRYNCPCETPGFWNTNWYDQMILIPGLVGNACLVLKTNLTATQFRNCTTQMSRAYVRIDGDPNGSMGAMTGANMLDVSSTGVSLALLTDDQDLIAEAINRYYDETQLTSGPQDGIKVDGTFMQHSSQIYNGNYGAVFMRTLLTLFLETKNTSFSAPASVQEAYLTVIDGSEWFMYIKNENDTRSPLLSWQYSVIGRMVSHKYEDWNGIGLNLNSLLEGTSDFENHANFEEIVTRLKRLSGVNPGPLIGTRFFHTSDYMVRRGSNYIVALKMFSTRSTNSECNNGQNPFGFHLSDGVIYTYLSGNEYTNVYGSWDWNLIPGSTVDYEATPLACNRVQFKGVESFVGGVALDRSGLAVMNYTNPSTRSMHWMKTYFFFPNAYAVQFVGEVTSTAASAPLYTTLDQRQLKGPVYIDGQLVTEPLVTRVAQKVWHDRVGYEFVYPVNLTVDMIERRSNWSAIGISLGNETQTLFAAYFEHPRGQTNDQLFTYITYLDVDQEDFNGVKLAGQTELAIIKNEKSSKSAPKALANVRGMQFGSAIGNGDRTISLAFLTAGEYFTGLEDITKVESDSPVLLLFQRMPDNHGWRLAASDPSQSLTQVNLSVELAIAFQPINMTIGMPPGAWAGSTTVLDFNF